MSYHEELLEKILTELIDIKKILILNSRDNLKRELNEIATTDERQKIWGLLDGMTSTSEIASLVDVSMRTVQVFVAQLLEQELVEVEKRGYYKRKMDYVPSDWKLKEVSRTE